MTIYYALDNPHPTYDYDCASNVLAYNGYTKDGHAFDGYTNEVNVGGGYYDEDYVYASWRLG